MSYLCFKGLGGQCLTSQNADLMVAFQVLSYKAVSWGGSFSTSVTSILHRTLDPIQFSPLVLQKRSLRASEVKAARLSGAELWYPGPLAPCPRRSGLLSGASLLGCQTPLHPTASHRCTQGTRQENIGPQPPREWGGMHRSLPATRLSPALGRTRLSERSRAGQSGRDRVPSRSPLGNLPSDS